MAASDRLQPEFEFDDMPRPALANPVPATPAVEAAASAVQADAAPTVAPTQPAAEAVPVDRIVETPVPERTDIEAAATAPAAVSAPAPVADSIIHAADPIVPTTILHGNVDLVATAEPTSLPFPPATAPATPDPFESSRTNDEPVATDPPTPSLFDATAAIDVPASPADEAAEALAQEQQEETDGADEASKRSA